MYYSEVAGSHVSAMSLGTVQLGTNYGIANQEGKPDRLRSFEILSTALKAGINAIDTARLYGDSEEVLGEFFKVNPEFKKNIFITTKLSSGLPAGSTTRDLEKAMTLSLETSLEKLGLAKINCLLLHNAADMKIHGPFIADTLCNFIKQGLTDLVGVSVYHPEEADFLLENQVYQAVQLPVNILDQRFIKSGVLDRLHKRGIKVFVRSVFFQGLLLLDPETIKDPVLIQFAVPHLLTLRQLSEKAGMSIARFALSFLQVIPGITSLVLGADNPGQVLQNIALFDSNSMENCPLDEKTHFLALNSFENIDYTSIMAVLSRPKG